MDYKINKDPYFLNFGGKNAYCENHNNKEQI